MREQKVVELEHIYRLFLKLKGDAKKAPYAASCTFEFASFLGDVLGCISQPELMLVAYGTTHKIAVNFDLLETLLPEADVLELLAKLYWTLRQVKQRKTISAFAKKASYQLAYYLLDEEEIPALDNLWERGYRLYVFMKLHKQQKYAEQLKLKPINNTRG